MARKRSEEPLIEPREFRWPEEIDAAIAKLKRRIEELEKVDMKAAVLNDSGEDNVARSNIRDTIRDVFGINSPEYREHRGIEIFAGGLAMGMSDVEFIQGRERGRVHVIGILKGLIGRLEEKRGDLNAGGSPSPTTYFDRLNLHPRILDVARELFMDGHPWEAVFAASKALVNYIKERADRHDLDGAPLVRTVFSKNAPILAFNDLASPTALSQNPTEAASVLI